ncbi:MAG: PEP-CTERM sorting domain-containing protein [Akkermansiaceae bacterium]
MKINTTKTTSALTALTLLAVTSASQAVVVYQDVFEGNIGNGNGVGGDFTSGTNSAVAAAGKFIDEGVLTSDTAAGNQVAWMHSINQFDLSTGFTLTVDFQTAATGQTSFTSTFGIIDEIADTGEFSTGNLTSFLTQDNATYTSLNALGLSATDRNGNQGINSDFGTFSTIEDLNSAIVLGTRQTFILTVNADGSANFSLDTTTGSAAAGTFSGLFSSSSDGEFYFAANSQGNTGLKMFGVTIDTLDAIPEPSSTALLGLSGLALLIRRRN